MSNFCRFANGGAKISIKSYFMEIIFFLSSELLDKNASIRSKLPTAACWSREITEENLKQTCFMSKAKATSVPQLGNHSQYSSHVGALNLIDESKSLPVEANNSTIKLHLPVEAKEKIVMINESKSLPVEANNSTIELHLAVEAKEKIAMIDGSKPLPVEANNSTIELHLAVEAKEKLSEYIESKSLPVEVKENFAIEIQNMDRSLKVTIHFQTRASRQILSRFHP